MTLVVVALGGNALLRRGEPPTLEVQESNAFAACAALARVGASHDLVVTHGNGPQVGLLALREALVGEGDRAPLDLLGAETEGMIGYLLERGMRSAMPDRAVAALLTQVLIDPDDPAFGSPTKPIGPLVSGDEARRIARERGWSMAEERDGWRRVVASPVPQGILELEAVRLLVDHGVVAICAGGGGVPVVVRSDGRVCGVEAVVDKDATAALLARQLQADALVLLTDVDGVYRDFGEPDEQLVTDVTPETLAGLDLPAGSMGPKVRACLDFVSATGGRAAIGSLDAAPDVVAGTAGTQFRRS